MLLLVQLLAAAEHSVMNSHHQHDEKNDTRTPATITVEETSATGTTAAMDMVRCVIAVVVAAKRDEFRNGNQTTCMHSLQIH